MTRSSAKRELCLTNAPAAKPEGHFRTLSSANRSCGTFACLGSNSRIAGESPKEHRLEKVAT